MGENFTSQSPTQTLNRSSEDGAFAHYGMTATEVISLTVLSSGISIIGTIANILVIVAVLLNRQLRETCTAILLASLSCFDLIICAVYVPMYIYDINRGSSAMLERVRNKFGFSLFLGSLNGMFAVSSDRFISICFPYRYVEWMTGKLTSIMIFATWFTTFVLSALSVPFDPPIYSIFYIAVVTALIIAFHIAMYWVAKREATQITRLYPRVCQRLPIWNKSVKAVAMVIATSLVCWAPIIILPVIVSPSSPSFLRFIKVTLAFTSLSSATNPFIFCWRLSYFRNALFSRLRKAMAAIHPN